MLPIYIHTYIHICSMCYWCHWCSTVFFKKSANRKSVGGSRESRLLRRAGDADQVHAGPWNWESRELGPDRDPGALAEGMSHPLFVIGGELGDWLLGEGGSQWAMGHLALANSGSKKCMFSAGKVCIAFEESTQNWDHLGLCQECKAFRLVPARSASNTSSSRAAGLTDFGSPWKSHKFQTPCRWLC